MVKTVHYLIAALVLLIACEGTDKKQTASEPVLPVTFAVFGNTGCVTDNGTNLKILAEAVNDTDIDFVVDLGNRLPVSISSNGIDAIWDAVDEDRKLYSKPVYPVVGKNDIFDFESDVAYSRRYGSLWYRFEHNGVMFIVMNTEDEAYRFGFGCNARIGEEQLSWLERSLNDSGKGKVVVFMHRPLWIDAPLLWDVLIQPLFHKGDVDLVVTCYDRGLFDWGKVDGIRAVSSGCTGLVDEKNIGLFPHVLAITITGDDISFTVHSSDRASHEGIAINGVTSEMVNTFVSSLRLPVLQAEQSWRVNESLRLLLRNRFSVPVSGNIQFSIYDNTRWAITPASLDFNLDPGITKSIRIEIKCSSPEFGPQPTYRTKLQVGNSVVYEYQETVKVHIPSPRTGDIVPISVRTPDVVPYSFGRRRLVVPVEIDGVDTCGRLIIYREGNTVLPVCQYISPLQDLNPGVNEFYWNGNNLEGIKVSPDTLIYRVCVYNKKAPATWVAVGPSFEYGTFIIERTQMGLVAKTHDNQSMIVYNIGDMKSKPKSEILRSFTDTILDLPLTGFAYGEKNRIYLGTSAGIASVILRKGKLEPDVSFGNHGCVRFIEYRGREIGGLSFGNGVIYVAIGGGNGKSPCIIALDGETGEELWVKYLGDFYGEESMPPAITANEHGLYCTHPDGDTIIHMEHNGDILWINESNSHVFGKDTDGRSFVYGIGVDQYGFTYVNTPGYSARCGVLGPDGRGLFRVILVQLPGLRVSSVIPKIEGKKSDGLYFVTRGGDVPYVFHVPYTVRSGIIVDEAELMR